MEHYKGDTTRAAPCFTQQYVHYLSNTSLHQGVAAEQRKRVTTKGLTPRGSAWDTDPSFHKVVTRRRGLGV